MPWYRGAAVLRAGQRPRPLPEGPRRGRAGRLRWPGRPFARCGAEQRGHVAALGPLVELRGEVEAPLGLDQVALAQVEHGDAQHGTPVLDVDDVGRVVVLLRLVEARLLLLLVAVARGPHHVVGGEGVEDGDELLLDRGLAAELVVQRALRLQLHEGVEEQLELLEPALLVVLHRELEPQVQRRHLGLQDIDDIVGVIGQLGAGNLDHLLGSLHGDEDGRHGEQPRSERARRRRGLVRGEITPTPCFRRRDFHADHLLTEKWRNSVFL